MSETDRAWAAGIIDGEGCIFIRRLSIANVPYYSLAVSVSQSGAEIPEILKKIHQLWGGSIRRNRPDKRANRQTVWRWQVTTAAAANFIEDIAPYLVGKKEQALLAIEYRRTALGKDKKAIQRTYFEKLQRMKHYQLANAVA